MRWVDRVKAFLLQLRCECRYLGDGDWWECERCVLLGRKR